MFTRGFMLDTSAINRICDWQACEWSLRGPLYVTDIQFQEILATRKHARRDALIGAFMSLRPTVLRPSGQIIDPEFFGFSSFHDTSFLLPQGDYQPMSVGRLMPHIAAAIGSKFEKHYRDALIAETARTEDLTLVTADKKLAQVGREFGIRIEEIP